MLTNQYTTKSIIGKKNLKLNSLSQKVKLGPQTYFLVQMIGNEESGENKYYSWENKYVIQKYFELKEEEFNELREEGRKIQRKNNWPKYKPEAVKQIMEKFFKLDAQNAIDFAGQDDEEILNKLTSIEKKQIITQKDNETFRRQMKRLAKKDKSLDFYVIKGFKKDLYTGEVQFYVKDQMGELKTKTLDEMKERNFMQVIHYLESKIVGFRKW